MSCKSWAAARALYSFALVGFFVAVHSGAASADTWFKSWQTPPAAFTRPYPAEHLRIIFSDDPDSDCGHLWERSEGLVYARACTVAPQNDPEWVRNRLAFIGEHPEWGKEWQHDRNLCVLILPRRGFFGVSDEEWQQIHDFEEPHCWGWWETPPPSNVADNRPQTTLADQQLPTDQLLIL
jgi:hypothetical protein